MSAIADYSVETNMDVKLKCTNGKLWFSRYLLIQNEYFATILRLKCGATTQGADTNKEVDRKAPIVIKCAHSTQTMNYILNHLDPIRGARVFPENITELARAAHEFQMASVLAGCRRVMLESPKCEYLGLLDIFPDDDGPLVAKLIDRELLINITAEYYLELFKQYEESVVKIARQYARDCHSYYDKIHINPEFLSPNDYAELRELFNAPAATERLFKMALESWQEQTRPAANNKSKSFAANKLLFFRDMFRNSPEFRDTYMPPELETQIREQLRRSGRDESPNNIAMAVWYYYRENGSEEFKKKLTRDFEMCKQMCQTHSTNSSGRTMELKNNNH